MALVKVKKITTKDETADILNEIFDKPEIQIAYPKYLRLKSSCEQCIKILEILRDSPVIKDNNYIEFNNFTKSSRLVITDLFRVSISDVTNTTEEEVSKFLEYYAKMRESQFINTLIVIYDKLVPYRSFFSNLDKLSYQFITNIADTYWSPFPFATLNVKELFIGEVHDSVATMFLISFNKLNSFIKSIYDELQSPDIDMDKFIEIILINIEGVESIPELSRCREAFKAIKDSIQLLKNNFGKYYKDFIQTKDNTIIMQHFIIDVGLNANASPTLTFQFRKIVDYYKKISKYNNNSNPKIKTMFEKINNTFASLTKGTTNLVNIEEEVNITEAEFLENPEI